jgi:hypothetical protein
MVEGKDDQWSIINLMRNTGYDWDDGSIVRPFVHEVGGVTSLLAALSPALKTYERLGVVFDADLEADDRWTQVWQALGALGVSVPRHLTGKGVIVSPQGIGTITRLGAWLMPNNNSAGVLEDFLAALVPVGDPTWTHAEQATTLARQLGAPIRQTDQAKGALHAWLACRELPGQPFGTALSARVLDHLSPAANEFVEWFTDLFVK